MAIPENIRTNFEMIVRAIKNGDAAVLDCTDKQGKPAYLLVATQRGPKNTVDLIPFAQMIEGNPFDLYNPPALFDEASRPAPAATPAASPADDGTGGGAGAGVQPQDGQPAAD